MMHLCYELPTGVSREAVNLYDLVNGVRPPASKDALKRGMHNYLRAHFGEQWMSELVRMGMASDYQQDLAAETYIEMRKAYPDEPFCGVVNGVLIGAPSDVCLYLIHELRSRGVEDCGEVVNKVCEVLEYKYGAGRLGRSLSKIGIASRVEIAHAVDVYDVMEKSFPGASFVRNSVVRAWGEAVDAVMMPESEAVMQLIARVVRESHTTDRYDIMSELCDTLEQELGSEDMVDRYLEKLNLRSAKDMLSAIDHYFVCARAAG